MYRRPFERDRAWFCPICTSVGCSGQQEFPECPRHFGTGIRVSFPGTAGMLTAEQMVELIKADKVRVYYAEIEATEVPPCP
jgi:hypothetical protein